VKLVFLPEAVEDIDRLFHFLNSIDPRSAQKAMLALDEGIELLLENPLIGPKMKGRSGYRQLFVPFGRNAYVLRYRIDELRDVLVIVRVWHGRELREG
jgi:addiction module RelE/StbE family toxin